MREAGEVGKSRVTTGGGAEVWRWPVTSDNRPGMADTAPAPTETSGVDPVLAGFRRSIDNIDAALVHILAERFRITQAVGTYKATNALPPSDPSREERQIARLRSLAIEADLDPEFTEKFLRFVIDEVIRHHERAKRIV